MVHQFYLEWPHYPTGYGPADLSITGGVYVPGGGERDSEVPTHGVDWAPVLRHDVGGSSVAGLALSALLSQAFVAFAADFEELGIGGLHLAASVLRLLPDGGVPVSDIPMLSRLKGDGSPSSNAIATSRSSAPPARPGAARRADPRVRNTRDQYEPSVRRVEDRWGHKYGADVVARLRAAVESVDIDRSLPHSVIDTLT